jgi:hypothetical protein
LQSQTANETGYEYSPPRPYSWKTDEFQVAENKNSARSKSIKSSRSPSLCRKSAAAPAAARSSQSAKLAYGYHCPRCSSQMPPKVVKRVSTAGWIVFAVLMVIFFPLFWIGLLIKEDVRMCSVCNFKIA